MKKVYVGLTDHIQSVPQWEYDLAIKTNAACSGSYNGQMLSGYEYGGSFYTIYNRETVAIPIERMPSIISLGRVNNVRNEK